MKNLLSTVAASMMLLTCATSYAASTVDLTVKGLIVPSACTPSLSSGGIIDHGKISAKDLRPDNPTLIGSHSMTIAVICDGAIPFALNSIDNRADSALMGSVFGLGFINTTQKLGWYQLTLQNAVADGVQVKTIASGDGGNTWYDEKFWDPKLYMSVTNTDGAQPIAVKELVAQLLVDTSIARTDGLDLSNEVTLDGSATLEVKYL
jgi:type 1 fimbria pilin